MFWNCNVKDFTFFLFAIELLRTTFAPLQFAAHDAILRTDKHKIWVISFFFLTTLNRFRNNSYLKRAEVKSTGQEETFTYYQYTVSIFKAVAFRHIEKSIFFHRCLQFCHEPWQVGTGEGHGPSPFWCITTCAGNSDSVPSNPNFFFHYYYQATCWDCAAPLSPASERWQRALLGAVRTTLCPRQYSASECIAAASNSIIVSRNARLHPLTGADTGILHSLR